MLARAAERGEDTPDVESVLDRVVAPMMYRILFRPGDLTAAYARKLVQEALDGFDSLDGPGTSR